MNEISRQWMWSEACEMLARAERLHQQFFQPVRPGLRRPAWEPPVDMLETEREVLVLVALPGADPNHIEAVIEGADLIVGGSRVLPAEWQTAKIHRLELPQGRFERRLRLPPGRYGAVRHTTAFGCLVISLEKLEASRG